LSLPKPDFAFSQSVANAPRELLFSGGLVLGAPPFVFRIRSADQNLSDAISAAYAEFEWRPDDTFVDFDLSIRPVRGFRRFYRPLVSLDLDGISPFDPLPAAQAFPLLEWGLNWCVTSNAHQYLMVHSAVLAQGKHAVLLPAPPGSGKSTLCASLMLSGWRLLSDELALLEPESGMLVPFVRPVSLKNASISLIAGRFPQAILTRPVVDTVKGTVAHLRPSSESVALRKVKAQPRLLVFPEFTRGLGGRLEVLPLGHAEATVELARNVFNLAALGATGFEAMASAVERCTCFRLRFESLDEAVKWLSQELGTAPSDEHAKQPAY
jgi:HprK-related kinase A